MTTLQAVPVELRERAQWLMWKRVSRDGGTCKQPFRVNGQATDAAHPASWCTFTDSTAALDRARPAFDGVGFALAPYTPDFTLSFSTPWYARQKHRMPPSPYIGIDLDHVLLEDGRPKLGCEMLVARFCMGGGYVERSPGGDGLHIITRGIYQGSYNTRCEWPVPGVKAEIYGTDRYLTMTGRVYGVPLRGQIGCDLENVLWLERQIAQGRTAPAHRSRAILTSELERQLTAARAVPDAELLTRACAARNGGQLTALLAGDLSRHSEDWSAADLALCGLLAFWTGPDPDRIARLWRASVLGMRDKTRLRDDYVKRTVQRALSPRLQRAGAFCDWEHTARHGADTGGARCEAS